MASGSEKQTFPEMCLARLKKRARRLTALLDKNAPETIIARELGLVLHAGVCLYGSEVFNEYFCELIRRHARIKNGFCPQCGENEISSLEKDFRCLRCQLKEDIENQEIQEIIEELGGRKEG